MPDVTMTEETLVSLENDARILGRAEGLKHAAEYVMGEAVAAFKNNKDDDARLYRRIANSLQWQSNQRRPTVSTD